MFNTKKQLTWLISPREFHAFHFAFPTKSIIPGFGALHLPCVAWIIKQKFYAKFQVYFRVKELSIQTFIKEVGSIKLEMQITECNMSLIHQCMVSEVIKTIEHFKNDCISCSTLVITVKVLNLIDLKELFVI